MEPHAAAGRHGLREVSAGVASGGHAPPSSTDSTNEVLDRALMLNGVIRKMVPGSDSGQGMISAHSIILHSIPLICQSGRSNPNRDTAASTRLLNVLVRILRRRAASAATPPAARSALIVSAACRLVSVCVAMPHSIEGRRSQRRFYGDCITRLAFCDSAQEVLRRTYEPWDPRGIIEQRNERRGICIREIYVLGGLAELHRPTQPAENSIGLSCAFLGHLTSCRRRARCVRGS